MRQHIRDRVRNLLLDQLRLRFADGEVMPFALVGGQNGQQDDGEHGQNDEHPHFGAGGKHELCAMPRLRQEN